MTEAEWLAATEPTPLLASLKGKAGDRKRRLFAVACCRLVSEFHEYWACSALEAAEGFADGEVSGDELDAYHRQASDKAFEPDDDLEECVWVSISRTTDFDREDEVQDDDLAASAAAHVVFAADDPDETRESQAHLARDIFGNPFRPVALDPAWRTSTVLALAEGIYADRAFDRLPILADALQEAGCEHPGILAHCRGDGPHTRGCWVVDLVLGKS